MISKHIGYIEELPANEEEKKNTSQVVYQVRFEYTKTIMFVTRQSLA
jgi:hypothetical protein